MYCINERNSEFIALAEKSAQPNDVLKAKISIWQEENNTDKFPTLKQIGIEERKDIVQYDLKAIGALNSIVGIRETIRLNTKEKPYIETNLRKLLQGKGVYTEQVDMLFDYMRANNIQEISTEDLATRLAAEYSYTIKINLATESKFVQKSSGFREDSEDKIQAYTDSEGNTKWQVINTEIGVIESNFNTKEDALAFIGADATGQKPTSYYSNLTVPGGTNYTENEIATPAITPSIKGHAQFATDKGIGWFRSDEKQQTSYYSDKYEVVNKERVENVNELSSGEVKDFLEYGWIKLKETPVTKEKTRRILEVQSDLFQKGRDKSDLVTTTRMQGVSQAYSNLSSFTIDGILYYSGMGIAMSEPEDGSGDSKKISNKEYDEAKAKWINQNSKQNTTENQFLQLLNKDNNWVTFFVKSIIQDSAKKGYEKVLFPTGNTASKVEGHTTLEQFKKEKQDRIKELEYQKNNSKIEEDNIIFNNKITGFSEDYTDYINNIDNEITQLKQELVRVETEGFGALAPIFNFYENTVTNILKKQGYTPKKVTDEFGNTWNEIEIKEERDLEKIFFRRATLSKPKYKKADMDKATKFLEEKLGMTADEIVRVTGLIDNDNFGRMTTDGTILLSDLMEVGTEYHEAFHRVWNFYLTPEERQAVLEDFKKDPKYKEKIEYLKESYPELEEDDLIEEYFSEDFRDFMMSEAEPKTLLEKMYAKIIKFLNKLIGVSPKEIDQLYTMIAGGRFAKATKLVERTAVDKNRSVKIGGTEITAAQKSELLLNMDYYFSNFLFSPDILKKNNVTVNNIYNFTENYYSPKDVETIYKMVLNKLYDDLSTSKVPEAQALADLIANNINESYAVLRGEHRRRLASFNINTFEPKEDVVVSDYSNDITAQDNITKEEKDEQGRNNLDIIPAFEFNTKDSMPKVVKLLISTLPDVNSEGGLKKSSTLGITQAGSWNNNVNILKNELATLPADINIFMEKIKALSEDYKQFGKLLNLLGYNNGKTSNEFLANTPITPESKYLYTLRRSFVSEFSLTKYNFHVALLKKNGNIVFEAANEEHFLNILKKTFNTNFQRSLEGFKSKYKGDPLKAFLYVLKNTDTSLSDKLEMLGFEFAKKLSDADVELLRAELSGLITNIDEKNLESIYQGSGGTKFKGVNARINRIIEFAAKGMKENTELQFMNLEGKPVYLINLNTYQTIIIDSINYYLDVAESKKGDRDSLQMRDFRKSVLQENLPHLFNSQTNNGNSKWMDKILNGEKIEYGIIEGLKDEDTSDTTHASELKEGDLMSLNINMILSGLSVSMKHSDRSVYPIYRIGANSNIITNKLNPLNETVNAIVGYLKDEVKKLQNKSNYKYMDDLLKSKDSYIKKSFFGEIIPFETFKKLVSKEYEPTDKHIEKNISDYLEKIIKENQDQFEEYRLNEPYKLVDYRDKLITDRQSIGISEEHMIPFGSDKNPNRWKAVVRYAVLENILQTYEQAIFFVGDVTAYKGSTDLSKRLNTQSSTGKVSLIGEEIDRYVEHLNMESIFTIDGQDYIYKENYDTNTVRELVIKDPTVKSYLYGSIKESIKKQLLIDFKGDEAKAEKYAIAYSKAYEGYVENDGFSYTNIFMAREFEIRSDEWNDAKQRNFDLQIQFLNSGYNLDSIKDSLEVPEGENVGEWLFKNYGPLTIKKPQYVGPNDFTSNNNEDGLNVIAGRKTAHMPLMPTSIYDTALKAVHEFMLINSIDVLHMEGASKFGAKELRPLYDSNGKWDLQEITENQIGRLPWRYMKNQVKIANEPKGYITSSTQSRKNILEGFFDKGVPKDYPGTKEQWDSFSEEAKIRESSIYELVREYEKIQNTIIKNSVSQLLDSLDTTEITDKNIEYSVAKLKKVLVESAVGRNSPDNVIEAAEDFLNEIKYIELIPNSGKIQPILNALVTNNVLVQKRLGDMVPQAAVTGFESKPREYDEDGNMISSKDSLKFYELQPDGTISPAEIIIPVTPEVLEAAFVKYNTRNIIEAVQKLNEDIDRGALEVLSKGLRIPNQQFSSNDVFKIKKFLIPLMQGMAVIPSELVAKTGGDFDIDKISLYYYNLDEDGNRVKYYETHTDELFDQYLKNEGVYGKKGDIKLDKNYKSFSSRISNLEAQISEIGEEAVNEFIAYSNDTTGKTATTFKEAKENLVEQRKANKDRISQINDKLGSVYEYSKKEAIKKGLYIENFKELEAERKSLQEKNALTKKQLKDFYDTIAGTKELKDKKQSAIKAIRTRKTNIKEAFRQEFEATPVQEINTKEALENHFLDVEIQMLLHPSQLKNLYSPVADTPLQSSKNDHLTAEDKAGIPMSKLYNLGYNVLASIRFVSGKAGVGQLATWINFTDLSQRHGLKLNSAYHGIEINIEGFEGSLDLGNNLDAAGESISIVLSALLTSQVDLVKDPYAEALNIINQTLDTIAYMVVRGIPAATIIDIMKYPYISDFLKQERINQSMLVKSTGRATASNPGGLQLSNEALMGKFLPPSAELKRITMEQIKKKDPSIKYSVIDMFLGLRRQARDINKVKRYYSPDTKYLKDRNAVNALSDLFNEINNPETEPIITLNEQNKLISNNSLLQGFHEGRKLYDKLYNKYYFLDSIKEYQLFKRVIAQQLRLNTDDKAKFYESIDQNFITYLLQRHSSYIKQSGLTFDKVMKGKNSTANLIADLREDPDFADNLFVKNLLALLNNRGTGIDNFKSFKGKGTTSFINEQADSFDELTRQDPEIAANIVIANAFQSGTYNSIFQLNKFLPYNLQKIFLTDLNQFVTKMLASDSITAGQINEFMHKYLLSHTEYIPETWKFNPKYRKEATKIFPYAKDKKGNIFLVNEGALTNTKVETTGNYQGIDYNKEVPITDNFNNVTVTETEVSTQKINVESLDIDYSREVNVYAGTDQNTSLSNFSSDKSFTIGGEKFDTVEGYFQARKMDYSKDYYQSSIPGNMEMSLAKLERFKKAKGSNARLMGNEKELTGLRVSEWNAVSTEILKEGMLESFLQNPKASAELLATGNALLTHKNERGVEQDNGRFSKLLMEIREQLYQMTLQNQEEMPIFEEKEEGNPHEVRQGVDPVYQDLADRIDIEKFDAYFPDLAELSIDEKINFLKAANEDELKIVCRII
jgi:predicted NAD-dependent protein-ADP-ribosyltransferase YbiA (DUF1768 family)